MVMAARREQSNEGLVAAGFSAMLQRPVITQQEYEKRRHEPEFAKVEELNYERLSETVYTPAAGSFGDIFSENGVMINIRLTSLTGKVCVLNVREDSYVEELQVLFEEKENLSGYHGRLAFVYKDREIQEGHKLSEYQVSHFYVLTFIAALDVLGLGTKLMCGVWTNYGCPGMMFEPK